MAALYHKREVAGHSHAQAVCAVANARFILRFHHMLKAIKAIEGTFRSTPRCIFGDLSRNPISMKGAKALIRTKWGGVSY